MIRDFVNGLETILGNFSTYSSLSVPTVYKYERNVNEVVPNILLLPENTNVVAQEAGSEILQSNILMVFTTRADRTELPDLIYQYEEALRECVWNQKHSSDMYFKITSAEYGMSYTSGSVMLKNLLLTCVVSGQHLYE